MKVYTKTGDNGSTGLISGERVSKCDVRVEAYGTVDELSAFLALLHDKISKEQHLHSLYTEELERIGSTLMTIEAHLAAGEGLEMPLPELSMASVQRLEYSIDAMQTRLPQIDKFTLPGGHEVVSFCHVCRTVCRRAERRVIAAAQCYQLDEVIVTYLNRLSDYLYLLGRVMTQDLHVVERLWVPEM